MATDSTTPLGPALELREHYEGLRERAVAGRTMTLAMRMLIDRGVYAWIEAFGSRSCCPTSHAGRPAAGARLALPAPRPTELISLLATLVASGRTQEVHA